MPCKARGTIPGGYSRLNTSVQWCVLCSSFQEPQVRRWSGDRQGKTTIRNGCTYTWAEFKKGNIDLIYEGGRARTVMLVHRLDHGPDNQSTPVISLQINSRNVSMMDSHMHENQRKMHKHLQEPEAWQRSRATTWKERDTKPVVAG
jgi:hypothetical protein